MFVVTLRCNQKCTYCHASSQDVAAGTIFDMDAPTARKGVEIAFQSPSPQIKIEFQGGEPLLNFDIVKVIVEHAELLNEHYKKHVEFVLCTNLISLNENHLKYIKEKGIIISTSLDGPADIHNSFRKMRNGNGSYEYVVPQIELAIETLGRDKVSALMTVTPANVHRLKDVIDEYLRLRLPYIFIRKLNPFGYAYKNALFDYSVQDFIINYKNAIDYLVKINLGGTFFPEVFTSIMLSRILTPFSTGFVDLQSPAGTGISGVIYDTNGDVFVSDEARMMHRTTGDKIFCIGNVNNNSWCEIFCSPTLKNIIRSSCIDALPGCSWCVYKPYCGGDPVRNYLTQGDMIGYRPNNDFCHKHKTIFNMLFEYLFDNNSDVEDVFWSWLTNRTIYDIRSYGNNNMNEMECL